MNNTNQRLFTIYQNVFEFYNYRRLVALDSMMSQADFAKRIQKDKYILLSAVDKKHAEDVANITEYIDGYNEKSSNTNIRLTHILIIYPGTDCETKRANMLKFINHVRYPRSDVIIITETELSGSVLKGLQALTTTNEHQHHAFYAYTYDLLTSVIPQFELAPQKYEILTDAEVQEFEIATLPRVFEDDPQMVWIGAKTGNVVRFTYMSEITLFSIGYCVVVPSTQ